MEQPNSLADFMPIRWKNGRMVNHRLEACGGGGGGVNGPEVQVLAQTRGNGENVHPPGGVVPYVGENVTVGGPAKYVPVKQEGPWQPEKQPD